jgi:hypothetical protein
MDDTYNNQMDLCHKMLSEKIKSNEIYMAYHFYGIQK